MSTRLIIIGAAVLIVVAAVIGWYASHSSAEPHRPGPAIATPKPTPPKKSGGDGEPTPQWTPPPLREDAVIPAEAQEQLDQMNSFLDDRDDDKALPIVRKLLRSQNSDVRSQAIFAARWIGKETIPDLKEVLPETDEDGLRQILDALSDMIAQGEDGAEQNDPTNDYAAERAQAESIYQTIIESAKNPIATAEILDPFFNSFGPLPSFITLPVIERLIRHKNPIVIALALEAFRFNANGEEYVGPARTAELVRELTPPRDE